MLRHLLVATWLLTSSVVFAHAGLPAELASINRKLVEKPGDVDLLLQRATIYRQQRKLQGALADLGRVAQKAPTRRELFLERGLVEAALGRPAAAESDLTRFLNAGPPMALALQVRGAIREASKRWAPARADYDAAMALGPDVDLYLARGRMDEAQGALDRAAAGYEEGLKALHGAVVLRIALIRVETARGHHDRATALVDEVLASAPLKAEWLLRRADVHAAAGRGPLAQGDREAALQELDAQIDRRPNDLARLLRDRAYVALGRRADAIAELERVVKSSPRLAEANAFLSQLKTSPASRRGTP